MSNQYEFFKSQSFTEDGRLLISNNGDAVGTPTSVDNAYEFFKIVGDDSRLNVAGLEPVDPTLPNDDNLYSIGIDNNLVANDGDISDITTLLTNDLSVSFSTWFKTGIDNNQPQTVFNFNLQGQTDFGSPGIFALRIHTDYSPARFRLTAGGGGTDEQGGNFCNIQPNGNAYPISNNTWYHIAATFDYTKVNDSDFAKFYINSELVTNYAYFTISNSRFINPTIISENSLQVGGRINMSTGNSEQFLQNGLVDELSFFDYPLTQEDVTRIYNEGYYYNLNRLDTAPPLAWWRFGDGHLDNFDGSDWIFHTEGSVDSNKFDFKSINMDSGSVVEESRPPKTEE